MKILLTFIISIIVLYGEMPNWLFQSGDEKYIYGVGSAKKDSSISQQIKIASILARANLSENIGVEIKSKFEKEESQDSKSATYSISQTSSHLLRYSFIKDRWISEKGELFLLMAIERSDLR